MFELIENILRVIVGIINNLGYWGIGTGMLLESACIPLPSEIVLPLGGNMAANGIISLIGANIAAAAGSVAGSLLAYAIGFYGGRPLILRYSRSFFISEQHFYKAENSFNRFGMAAVFFGRLLPVIRTFISLPAGVARMDLKKFLSYSLAGMLPWNFILIYLGFKFGQEYETVVRPLFKRFEYLVVAVMVLAILFLFIKSVINGRKHTTNKGL